MPKTNPDPRTTFKRASRREDSAKRDVVLSWTGRGPRKALAQVINERVTAIFMVISTKVRTPIMTHKAEAGNKQHKRERQERGRGQRFWLQDTDVRQTYPVSDSCNAQIHLNLNFN